MIFKRDDETKLISSIEFSDSEMKMFESKPELYEITMNNIVNIRTIEKEENVAIANAKAYSTASIWGSISESIDSMGTTIDSFKSEKV